MGRFRYLVLALASVFLVAAGGTVTAGPASASVPTGWVYLTTATDGGQALTANGCGNPANIIQWSLTDSSCQHWHINNIGGETDIYAYYGGNWMCMGVYNFGNGDQVYAFNCDNSNGGVQWYEEWKLGCNNNNQCWIYPWSYQQYCLNVAGGNGQGRNVVLWGCSPSYSNEQFTPR
jgi:hypothetical protein